jgi:hypothetical protein
MRGLSHRTVGALVGVLAAFGLSAAPALGAAWSPLTVPDNGVSGLACVSTHHCLAFGYNSTLSWNGGRWSRVASPAISEESTLDGLTCRSAGSCVAVGSALVPDGVPLIERLHGGVWSTQPSPDPIQGLPSTLHETSGLVSVACPAARWCVAVGAASVAVPHLGVFAASASTPNPEALIERWNGRRWSIVRLVPLRGRLDSVSCSSIAECVAVGDSLMLRWNGRHWVVQRRHRPRGVRLASVSCPAASDCVAVGHRIVEGAALPAAERWNGKRWSLLSTALPGGRTDGTLQAVDCVSARLCQAVGQSYSDNVIGDPMNVGPLVATPRRGGWKLTALPPAGPPIESLSAVSCVSARWCMAAGNGFAERYS